MLSWLCTVTDNGRVSNLVVVRFSGSEETEIYLDARHREAMSGDLIGLMAISMYAHNHYALALKGEIRRSPIFARGLLPQLGHELDLIIRGK